MKKLYLLIALLLVAITVVPSTAIADTDNGKATQSSASDQLMSIETEINEFISEHGLDDLKDADKLTPDQRYKLTEMLLQHVKLVSKQQDNHPVLDKASASRYTLNGDTPGVYMWYGANGGGANSGRTYWPAGTWEAGYWPGQKQAESTVFIGPPGNGAAWAWASVGVFFTASGSQPFLASFDMNGEIYGALYQLLGGVAEVEINLVVRDMTTGSTKKEEVLRRTTQIGPWYAETFDHIPFGNQLVYQLRPGRQYCVFLEVWAHGASGGASQAMSDFGRFDGDPGHTMYNFIEVTVN